MKNILPKIAKAVGISAFCFLLSALLLHAAAIKTGYVQKSITLTTPTNTAEVYFPQEPTSQIRLVSYEAATDTNSAANLTIYGGTMPLTITGVINVTNLLVTSNTFVLTNSFAIIQRTDDTVFGIQLLMTNQTTNIIIQATNALATITTNDVLWLCTNITSTLISQSPASNLFTRVTGECLFQAQRRAPVGLRITNGLNLNTRLTAVVKYDVLP